MKYVSTREEFTALGSAYTIVGAGGNLEEWVAGYKDMLEDAQIFTKSGELQWYTWTGEEINKAFALVGKNSFLDELTFIAFAINGEFMDIGRLAMFRLRQQDHWLDDLIANARR